MPRSASSCWARSDGAWHLSHQTINQVKASFAGFEVTCKASPASGPNYIAERATFRDRRQAYDSDARAPAVPVQKRQVAGHPSTPTGCGLPHPGGRRANGWVITWLNPLAPWIWLGAAMCALGGFVSLSDRRLRIGAPKRSRAAAQPAE